MCGSMKVQIRMRFFCDKYIIYIDLKLYINSNFDNKEI